MKETSLALSLSFMAFIMTVIWGSPLIDLLKYFKVGKIIREEGPDNIGFMDHPCRSAMPQRFLPISRFFIFFNPIHSLAPALAELAQTFPPISA